MDKLEQYNMLRQVLTTGQIIKDFGDHYEIVDIPLPTEAQIKQEIRIKRETECFTIINRGQLWYNKLSEPQKQELQTWYQAWLDAPTTLQIPTKPSWLV